MTSRLATSALLALGLLVGHAAAEPVRIATVTDGPWERNAEILALFRTEITTLTGEEFDVTFPESLAISGDWTIAGIRTAVDRALSDPRTDLVLAMGVVCADIIGSRGSPRVPVVCPFVLDRRLQNLPIDATGASGVANLSYLDGPDALSHDLDAFLDIVSLHHLAFLSSPLFVAEVPGLEASLDAAASTRGVRVTLVTASGTAGEVLEKIPPDADAVYFTPLPQLGPGAFDTLIDGVHARGLPTFSFLGRPDVMRGVLAGLRPESYFERLARRTALHVQSILLGDDAGSLAVAVSVKDRLVINMRTARRLGVNPSFAVLTEAELVQDERAEAERVISLSDVVAEAMRRNPELAASERDVAAARADVGIARARLLPRIDLSATGVVIDEDRAAASLGSQAERTLDASARLSQVIWSEPAWAGLSSSAHARAAREAAHDTRRLDTVLAAASAYLRVLIAKTSERIARTDLELTRSNLELAQVRESVGTSGPSDVLRWKSAIATGRRTVIQANAERNVAEMTVNRILDRPLEESFLTVETSIDDPSLITGDDRLDAYLRDPWTFRAFRGFIVEEGLSRAPELREIDEAIAAQQRALASATNAFFSPTIALQGEVDRELDRGGAGTGGSPLSVPGLEIPQADETSWSVALTATLPLSTGGSRIAERRKASEALVSLTLQRRARAGAVELRIRSALHRMGASHAAIALARDAARAARRNLDIITDAYRRGVTNVIDLLDAQNAAVVADEAAANAVFAFLLDLMEVERASGRFAFFTTPEERDAFFERLADFVASRRDG